VLYDLLIGIFPSLSLGIDGRSRSKFFAVYCMVDAGRTSPLPSSTGTASHDIAADISDRTPLDNVGLGTGAKAGE
jgi:hypothetical protein